MYLKTVVTSNLTKSISVKLGDLLLHTLPSGDGPEHLSLPLDGSSNCQDFSAQPHLPPCPPPLLCRPRWVCNPPGGVHEQVCFLLQLKSPSGFRSDDLFHPDSTCFSSPHQTAACSSSQCMETECYRPPRSSPSSTSTCWPSTSRPQSVRLSGASFSPSSSFFFSWSSLPQLFHRPSMFEQTPHTGFNASSFPSILL